MGAGRLPFMEAMRRRDLRLVAFGERPSLHGLAGGRDDRRERTLDAASTTVRLGKR